MFKTNASIRRFIALQERANPDAPSNLIDRYSTYVWCVAKQEYPKTFKEWLEG